MNFRVLVAGWSNPRSVSVKPESVTFEVALHGHCRTCDSRIALVQSRVNGDDSLSYSGGSVYMTTSRPEDLIEDKASIAEFLSKKLCLPIRPL